jgi:polyisoprenoid-binding protein YceI
MRWVFEPGHSAAEFRARHMMVTWVRGSFKRVNGNLDFDPAHPQQLGVEAIIDSSACWTGEPARDDHLRSPDFLSCERYPEIRFKSTGLVEIGPVDYRLNGDLTIRDVTKSVTLDVRYLGSWQTPWWEGSVDKGPKTRAGFTARTRIDRYDFGVDWNDKMPDGGIVVSRMVDIVIDVEAIAQG